MLAHCLIYKISLPVFTHVICVTYIFAGFLIFSFFIKYNISILFGLHRKSLYFFVLSCAYP